MPHFLAACETKTIICLAGGLPTDGGADLRMNTFAACGSGRKTIEASARKLDHCGWTNTVGQGHVRGLFNRSSAPPSVGTIKRSHIVALPLKPFGGMPFRGKGRSVSPQIRR